MVSRKFRSLMLVALASLLLVAAVGVGVPAAGQQDDQAATPTTVPLPRSENPDFDLKPGGRADLVIKNCIACHTLTPIITHDGFSPDVWESEVEKMRDSYGADISDEDAEAIVGYLSDNYSDAPGSTRDMLIGGGTEHATPNVTPAGSPETGPPTF